MYLSQTHQAQPHTENSLEGDVGAWQPSAMVVLRVRLTTAWLEMKTVTLRDDS